MPCDRCGGAMDTYELEGRDARVCRDCGYVDVPVRHEPEGGESESWDDAISRFHERFVDVTVSETDLPGPASDGESPDGAPSDDSSGDATGAEPSGGTSETEDSDAAISDGTSGETQSDASEETKTDSSQEEQAESSEEEQAESSEETSSSDASEGASHGDTPEEASATDD